MNPTDKIGSPEDEVDRIELRLLSLEDEIDRIELRLLNLDDKLSLKKNVYV